MRHLLVGLYSGMLLATLRAPLGLELLQLPASEPSAALAYRAAGLLAVAIGLLFGCGRGAESFSPVAFLGGAAAGFTAAGVLTGLDSPTTSSTVFALLLVGLIAASHRGGAEARPQRARVVVAGLAALIGWYLLMHGPPQGHVGALLTVIGGATTLVAVGRLGEPEGAAWTPSPQVAGRAAGLAAGGAGLALACEGLARPTRQLCGGLPLDDLVLGAVFLGLVAFGAAAFGRLAQRPSSVQVARAALLALTVVAVLVATGVLENISTVRGLDRFVRRFQLDLSLRGTLLYDAVLGGAVFVVPAFLVGAIAALCRRPVDLAALLVGGAVGLVLLPSRLHAELVEGALVQAGAHSISAAYLGAALAAGGALALALGAREPGRAARAAIGALGVAALAFAGYEGGRVERLEFSRPWARRPPTPELFADLAVGVLTVERSPAGSPVATLDGRPLAPPREEAGPDLERLRLAWSLLPEGVESPEVLLVGQLTPERADLLQRLGAARVDRSAAWYVVMPALEERLFGGPPALEGEVLPLRAARDRLNAAAYDLVIVPALSGPTPTTRNLASPPESTVVVWLDGASGVETLPLGPEVLVSAPGLRELYVGLARGPGVEEALSRGGLGAPASYPAGTPLAARSALKRVLERDFERARVARARLARRLAEAEVAPGLLGALATHFEAQRVDSPFESPELALELEGETIEVIGRAAAAPAPDALAVECVEALAQVLRAKRRVDDLERALAPAAERHGPWPLLEVSLGQADLELLDPATAVARLELLLDDWAGTAEAWAMLAEAQQQVGEDAAAVRSLERALELLPENHELERRLAIALVRAGRPEGPEALEACLEEDPDDEELLQYRSAGPWEAVRPGYHPLGSHSHDAH